MLWEDVQRSERQGVSAGDFCMFFCVWKNSPGSVLLMLGREEISDEESGGDSGI